MNGPVVYRFRNFRLDPRRRRLETSEGASIHLTPKAFDALAYLVERHGDVISRRDLTDALWPETVVDENNLSQVMSAVRGAVGKDCIATVPGRGYQFVADVHAVERATADTAPEQPDAVAEAAGRASRRPGLPRVVPWAAAVLVLASGIAYLMSAGSRLGDSPLAEKGPTAAGATLAVLPFADMSPGADFDYWAEGISSELISVLGRIENLEVTPASSSFYFKGRDVDTAKIAEKLGVRYLLEGDVRVADDRLRISVGLSDTRSGFQIWNETYPTGDAEYFPVDDYFMVQDAITREVAEALQITLGVGAIGTRVGMTRDARAFREYLQAGYWQDIVETFDPDVYRKSIGHLERAVDIDPSFSLAWLGIAQRYSNMRSFGVALGELPVATGRAEFAMSKVRELTPDLPELALFAPETARDSRASSRDFVDLGDRVDRYVAAARRHSYPTAERLEIEAIFLRFVGRSEKSLPLLVQAYHLDPLSGRVAGNLTGVYAIVGDYAAAFEVADELKRRTGETTELQIIQEVLVALGSGDRERIAERIAWFEENRGPDNANVRMGKLLGQPARALAGLRREFATTDELPPTELMLALVPLSAWAAYFGDHELALQMHRRFLEQGQGNLVEGFVLNVPQPIFDGMRRLEGFKDLVADVGLVEYWRATGHWSDYCRPVDADQLECF